MTTFKALIVCIGLILSLIYFTFSYIQTSKNIHNKNEALFLQTQEEIIEALEQFQRYLNLIESRLYDSFRNNTSIPEILSLRVEHFIDSRFPEIITLTYIPAKEPTTSYSKYGKTVFNVDVSQKENEIVYLGKGIFKTNKRLYDQKQKPFGKLHVTFSIESSLYRYFSENEISLLPEQQLNITDNPFAFKLSDLPYGVTLNKASLSFQEFIAIFKLQILTVLAFGVALLLSGIALGTFFKHKIVIKHRTLNQQLRDALKTFKKKYADVCTEALVFQNLLKLKEKAKKRESLLSNTLQDRYRQMAAQAQSINILTSRLIAEEAGNDKLLKEIHSISKESTTVLGQLVKGYPAKEIEEKIDVLESIKNIKKIFLPEIIERNITFEIKGKIKSQPFLDKLTFEIVIHNVFHIIMGRLSKDNSFKINLKEKKSLDITFYDNGYDVEAKLYAVKNAHGYEDFLRLEKNKLREFTRYLGWELYFQSEKGSLNSIRLSIPQAFQEKTFQDNVINLFDFQPSGA